ncbi:phage holin [Aerococcaceae bacterium NML160702]|nr:phage holin [Aerococcaceae bacterium NML160702]
MKKINWRVRAKNKNFWLALIPALALLAQAVMAVFEINLDFGATVDRLLVVVNTLFVVLALVGIVNDPTTQGLGDSERALTYEEPK